MSIRRQTRASSRIQDDIPPIAATPRRQQPRQTVASKNLLPPPAPSSVVRPSRPPGVPSTIGGKGKGRAFSVGTTPRGGGRAGSQRGGRTATRRSVTRVAGDDEAEGGEGSENEERLLTVEDLMMGDGDSEEEVGRIGDGRDGPELGSRSSLSDVFSDSDAGDQGEEDEDEGDMQSVDEEVGENEEEAGDSSEPSSPTMVDASPLLRAAEELLELIVRAADEGDRVDEGQLKLRWEVLKSNKAFYLPSPSISNSLSASLSASSPSYFLSIPSLPPPLQAAARTSDLATFLRALVLANPSPYPSGEGSDVGEDLNEAWRLFLKIFDPRLMDGELTMLLDFSTQLFIRRIRSGLLRRDRPAVLDELFSRSLIDRRISSATVSDDAEGRRRMNDRWIAMRDARVKALKTISMANLNSSYSFVAFEREMVRFCHSRYRTEVLADEDGANEEGDERDYVVPLNDGPKSRKRGRADERPRSTSRQPFPRSDPPIRRRQTIATYNRSASTGPPAVPRSRSHHPQLDPTPNSKAKRKPRRSLPSFAFLASEPAPSTIVPLPEDLLVGPGPVSKRARRERGRGDGGSDWDGRSVGARSEAELEEMLAEEDDDDDESDEELGSNRKVGEDGEEVDELDGGNDGELGLSREDGMEEQEALASEEESLQSISEPEDEEEESEGPGEEERDGLISTLGQSVDSSEGDEEDATFQAEVGLDGVPSSAKEDLREGEANDPERSEGTMSSGKASRTIVAVEVEEVVKESVVIVEAGPSNTGPSSSARVELDAVVRLRSEILNMSLLDELTEEELLAALEQLPGMEALEGPADAGLTTLEQPNEPLFIPESSVSPPSPTASELARSRLAKGKGRALPTNTPAYSPPLPSSNHPAPTAQLTQHSQQHRRSSQPGPRSVRKAFGTEPPEDEPAPDAAIAPPRQARPKSTLQYPPGYEPSLPLPISSAPNDLEERDDDIANKTASPPFRRIDSLSILSDPHSGRGSTQTALFLPSDAEHDGHDGYPPWQQSPSSQTNPASSKRKRHQLTSASQFGPSRVLPHQPSLNAKPRSQPRSRSQSLDSPSLPPVPSSSQKRRPQNWGAKEDGFFRIAAAEVPLKENQPWRYLERLYGEKGSVNRKLAGRNNTALRDRMRVILAYYPYPTLVPPGLERYLAHTDPRRAGWLARLRTKSYGEITEGHVDPRKLGTREGRQAFKEALKREEKALREKRRRLEALEALIGDEEEEEGGDREAMRVDGSGTDESEDEGDTDREEKESRRRGRGAREKGSSQRATTRSTAVARSSVSVLREDALAEKEHDRRTERSSQSRSRLPAATSSQSQQHRSKSASLGLQPPRQTSVVSSVLLSRRQTPASASPAPAAAAVEAPSPPASAVVEHEEEEEGSSDFEAPPLEVVFNKPRTRSAVAA